MNYQNSISKISEKKAEELYHSLALCNYCKTPFKECDTIIPGKGLILGGIDVVKYKNRFWHQGCIFDFKKGRYLKNK
ncbi:MAG: hypothetical protein ISS45_03340 [Candidatus Omnitrophica bacterium]|nr:hypothetical protein [Candidatus Omnitrophota bacterium]